MIFIVYIGFIIPNGASLWIELIVMNFYQIDIMNVWKRFVSKQHFLSDLVSNILDHTVIPLITFTPWTCKSHVSRTMDLNQSICPDL